MYSHDFITAKSKNQNQPKEEMHGAEFGTERAPNSSFHVHMLVSRDFTEALSRHVD